MGSSSKGHVTIGALCAMAGAPLLIAGAVRPAFLAGAIASVPLSVVAITCGLVLLVMGAMIVLLARRPDELAPEVPAHVAFNSRMSVPAETLPTPPRRTSAQAPKLPQPAAPGQQRVAPQKDDVSPLDAQIRELTRQINKAGVMLATGQLSQGGYLAYVEDLKKQRGSLEAQRVRAELKT